MQVNIDTVVRQPNSAKNGTHNSNRFIYLVIGTIADQHFFQRMNSNLHQVVIYIKTAFMLSDEIFSNSNWDDHSCKSL